MTEFDLKAHVAKALEAAIERGRAEQDAFQQSKAEALHYMRELLQPVNEQLLVLEDEVGDAQKVAVLIDAGQSDWGIAPRTTVFLDGGRLGLGAFLDISVGLSARSFCLISGVSPEAETRNYGAFLSVRGNLRGLTEKELLQEIFRCVGFYLSHEAPD